MSLPVVQHLRSKVAGARPGDGTIRWLNDGEIFINQTDGVFCFLANTGAMITVPLGSAGAFATTASLQQALAGFMDLGSQQTITGAKTHTGALIAPTPATSIGDGSAATMLALRNVLAYVTPQMFGAGGIGGDDTAAIQAAVNTGREVRFPAGVYFISQPITVSTAGQVLRGSGRTCTTLVTDGRINTTTSLPKGMIVMTAGSVRIVGMTLQASQPNVSTYAGLITYTMPAILGLGRFELEHLCISGWTTGIDMRGNQGGAYLRDIQMSAFGTGILIDGCEDTVRIDTLHWYPFNIPPATVPLFVAPAASGGLTCISSGRCDDLIISNSLFIGGQAIKTFIGSMAGGLAGPTFGSITGTDFDTFDGIAMAGGDLYCAACFFTLGAAASQSINITAGAVTLAACTLGLGVATTNPAIQIAGDGSLGAPNFDWAGGSVVYQATLDCVAVQIGNANNLNGSATLSAIRFYRPSTGPGGQTGVAYSNPVVAKKGTMARLSMSGSTMQDAGSGGGYFVIIDTQNYDRITGNVAPNWNNVFPSPAGQGIYSYTSATNGPNLT